MIMKPVEAQKTTLAAPIAAYNAWDIDAILGLRAPDCQHPILLASLEQRVKTNDEYRRYFQQSFVSLSISFRVSPCTSPQSQTADASASIMLSLTAWVPCQHLERDT